MSHSDYLFIKSKPETFNMNSSSSNTQKKQIQNIQRTLIINDDYEFVENKRFNISLKNYISIKTTKNDKKSPMFSIPRIQVIEYIKNRYQPPFCWTCNTPVDDLLSNIACSLCEGLESSDIYDLTNNIVSSKYEPLFQLSSMDPKYYITEQNEHR